MRKKIKYILLLTMIFGIVLSIKSFARITTNDPNVNSGETVTITVNSQEGVASGAINLTSNEGLIFQSALGGTVNGTLVAFSKTDNVTSGLATYTFTAPEVSENKTYKLVFSSQDMADKDGNPVSSSTATATVTVKAKEQTPPVEPQNPTTPEQPVTPEQPTTPEQPNNPAVTEPEFTSVNRTMYTTGDVNLRDSWSTRSNATKVQKGTELTVTGTSNDKVNDYVWYRVSYNGKTKYIASYLLTNTKPEEKSNNVNLKLLEVEGQQLSPAFSPETISYTMQIEEEVTKLEIKAEAEDEKATVTIKGNEELKEGENIITIIVTAEDGTTKNYEIKATKLEKGIQKLGLTSLKVKGTTIETMFKPEVYNYEIEIKDITKLEIEAIANDETATVEILGNEELKEGENIITIIVATQEGEEQVTYQIKANKVVKPVQETKQIDSKIYLYAGIGGVVLIALIIVVVYTIKHRKQEEFEYTDNFEGLPEELPERKEKPEIDNEKIEGGKTKIDYLMEEQEDSPRNRRGKHF